MATHQPIFVLFSVFNSSKLLLSCVKRAYESINIYSFDNQYKLIFLKFLRDERKKKHIATSVYSTETQVVFKAIFDIVYTFN